MTTLSSAELGEARDTLTRIYHAAGIGVQWKTVEADFTVFVISRPPPAERISRFVVGYVPSTSQALPSRICPRGSHQGQVERG